MRILDWLRDGVVGNRSDDRHAARTRIAQAQLQQRDDPSGPHHFGRRAHKPDPNGHYGFGDDPARRMVRPNTRPQ